MSSDIPLTAWVGFAGVAGAGASADAGLALRAPSAEWRAWSLCEVAGVVAAAESAARGGAHVFGSLSYESAPAFERAAAVPAASPRARAASSAQPLAWFAAFPASPPHAVVCSWADACAASGGGGGLLSAGLSLGAWSPSCDRPGYDGCIARVRAAIARGETYQVNHTLRLQCAGVAHGPACAARAAAPPRTGASLMAALLRAQRCAYGAFAAPAPGLAYLSASPELFFRWAPSPGGAGALETRPMKGTRPRALWPAADAAARAALAASAKDAAENVMIVDLLRADVGRLALPGTVAVADMLAVERFPTVWQMTSTVRGATPAGTSLAAVLRALFPCGSVTGAPKLATMAAIAELEGGAAAGARGVYCGALLHIAPGPAGAVTASVPIRTLVLAEAGRDCGGDGGGGAAAAACGCAAVDAEYGVGGGVTWESTADGEWDEAAAKAVVLRMACGDEPARAPQGGDAAPACAPAAAWARALAAPPRARAPPAAPPAADFSLLETLALLRAGDGRLAFAHRDAHLARAASAADFFGRSWDARAAAAALDAAAAAAAAPARVRLLVDAAGAATTEAAPLPAGAAPAVGPPPPSDACDAVAACLARAPTHSQSPMLYHKTTARGAYDAAAAGAAEAWAAGEAWPLPLPRAGEDWPRARAAGGGAAALPPLADVLLFNEHGCATEFARGSLVVRRADGALVTPPVADGLLPGVFRAALLAAGVVREGSVRVDELPAEAWMANSVRGWTRVRLFAPAPDVRAW
jgi:para-aminobenzoate synthetase/4-amino-4-deoxychorismate lyase